MQLNSKSPSENIIQDDYEKICNAAVGRLEKQTE